MAPPALVATAGGATSNVYVTLANAETYITAHPYPTGWTGATDDAKNTALLRACQVLDWQKWLGNKGMTTATATTQALAWPRRWAPTLEYDAPPDALSEYFIDTSVIYYSSLVIPAPIWKANIELALELLRVTTDPYAAAADPNRDVVRKKIDVLEWEYLAPQLRARGLGRFPAVMALVGPVLRGATGTAWQRA